MVVNKNGRGTARSTSLATPSAYEKQNDGEPGQTADVPVIMKVINMMTAISNAVLYTFIHHEGSKYMKTIRRTNNRQETTSMYMTGREIDRRKIN